MNDRRLPAPGDVLELPLEELDERGRTLGRFEEFRVAVRGGVLGARVRARVRKRRRRGIEAVLEETLTPSPWGEAPRCPHFGSCGGCSFQGLAYRAQLLAKERMLARTLGPLALPGESILPVLACETPWHYRNKMDFTFGSARWIEPGEPEEAESGFALGLHARGHYHKVLDVQSCDIAFPEASALVASARQYARAHGLTPWDLRLRSGLLRHLVLRKSWASGEILASVVTTAEDPERMAAWAEDLLARHPELTTLVQVVNPGVAMVASGALARVFRGTGRIVERLDGLDFSISAESFFQTNTPQAERLVELVRTWAAPRPGDAVFDLYCGCGVFALSLARAAGAGSVVGFEIVGAAVEDARANASRNGLQDVRFVAGDLALTLVPEQLALRGLRAPAVVVVDPPRAGLHARVVDSLRVLAPRRLVYVSCNPQAAVRDLELLGVGGLRVRRVQPVDLFPHTPHLECVFLLEAG